MGLPIKKFYQTIVISDSSDDEAPPSKIAKIANGVEHTPQNDHKKSVRKRRYSESVSGAVCDISSALKRKKTVLAINQLTSNDVSTLYVHQLNKILAASYYGKSSDNFLFLSKLLSHRSTIIALTVRKSSSVSQHSRDVLRVLIPLINEVTGESQAKETVPSKMEFRINISRRAVCASYLSILNLMFLNPQCDVFVETVGSVVMFCQSLVGTICSINDLLDKMVLRLDVFIAEMTTLYDNVINLAFLINLLLARNKLSMDEFVMLVMDIALLPTVGGGLAKRHARCLYLVRSVLKSNIICWEKCTTKIYSVMLKYSWSEESSLALESGKRANKFTLLLLTVMQSSAKFPDIPVNARAFVQSLTLNDLNFILGRQHEENQVTEGACSLLGNVLDNADFILWHFHSLVKENLEEEDCLRENFGKFIEDLLALFDEYQWPAAEYTLITLCYYAVKSLKEDKLPTRSCQFLLKCLGIVFMEIERSFLFLDIGNVRCNAETTELECIDSWDTMSQFEEPVEVSESLPFLQVALVGFLIKRGEENWTQDGFLFWLAGWFTNKNPENCSNLAEVDWKLANDFVSGSNVNHVVNRIVSLRRSFDVKIMFNEVVKLRSSKLTSKNVMELVLQLCQVNSRYVETTVIKTVLSNRHGHDSVELRRLAVRCITEYLLHRPEDFGSYSSVFHSYMAESEAVSVRSVAVRSMVRIGLKFYWNPKILKKCLLLLKSNSFDAGDAATLFCKIVWLSPVTANDEADLLNKKVSMLINMFALIEDSDFVEEVFPNVFRLDAEGNERTLKKQMKACEQIVGEMARRCFEEQYSGDDRKTFASFSLLYLLAKITPGPLVERCTPAWLCFRRLGRTASNNMNLLNATTKVMEIIAPLIPSKDKRLLPDIELMSLCAANRFNKDAIVSGHSTACSIATVRQDYLLLKMYSSLSLVDFSGCCSGLNYVHEDQRVFQRTKRLIQKTLMMFGVIFKSVDMDRPVSDVTSLVLGELQGFAMEDIISLMVQYCCFADEEIRQMALFALGCVCLRYRWLMVVDVVQRTYLEFLESNEQASVIQVVMNIYEYLRSLLEYSHKSKGLDRKPPLTGLDGNLAVNVQETIHNIAETICVVYFEAATRRYFHPDVTVRSAVFDLLIVVEQCNVLSCDEIIPLLATMASDPKKQISERAHKHITLHWNKHPHCIFSASTRALSMSSDLYKIIPEAPGLSRGYFIGKDGKPSSRNWLLNSSVLKSEDDHEKFISFLLDKFGSDSDCIFDLLFYADNLVYFDYHKRKDIISMISRISQTVSCVRNTVLEGFDQVLHGGGENPYNVHESRVHEALRVLLLLEMKSFFVRLYGIEKIEVKKFEANKPYRIRLNFKQKSVYVSDRSYADRITKKSWKLVFEPAMSTVLVTKGSAVCCGRGFSQDTLELFYTKLDQLLNGAGN